MNHFFIIGLLKDVAYLADPLATPHIKKGATGEDAGLAASLIFPRPWKPVSQFTEIQSSRVHPPMVGEERSSTATGVNIMEDPSKTGVFSEPLGIPERGVGTSLIANRKNLLPFW